MADLRQLTLIEETLAECERMLLGAAPSPATRELRVRHGALLRVVRGWMHIPAHDAQVAAMLECLLELRGQVVRSCPPAPGPVVVRAHAGPSMPRRNSIHARTTRPPPRSTRPPGPARLSEAPPSSRRG